MNKHYTHQNSWYPAPTAYTGRKCRTEQQQCSHLNRLIGALKCQQQECYPDVRIPNMFFFFCRSALELKGCGWSQRPQRDAVHNFPTTYLITLRKADTSLQREFFVISIYNMSQYVSHSLLVNENCHPSLAALTSSTHLSFSLARRRRTHTHASVCTPPY